MAKSLKISFGSSYVNLRAFGSKFWQFRFPVYTFQTKKTALDYLYPFLSFSVHNFCARTDGRTDGRTDIFWKSFIFSSWSGIYIHVYTYLDYFSNFTPILTKVSIPFSLWKWVWKWKKFTIKEINITKYKKLKTN